MILVTPRMSPYVAHRAGKSSMSDYLCFTTPINPTSTCVLVLFEHYEHPKKTFQQYLDAFVM